MRSLFKEQTPTEETLCTLKLILVVSVMLMTLSVVETEMTLYECCVSVSHRVAVDDNGYTHVPLEMLAVHSTRPTTSAVFYCRNVKEERPRRRCIVYMVGSRHVCTINMALLAGT